MYCTGRRGQYDGLGSGSGAAQTEVFCSKARRVRGERRGDTYDVVDTTDDTSGQLGAERVPHTVFNLGSSRGTVLALGGLVDRDAAARVSRMSPRSCVRRVRLPFLAVDFKAGGNGAGEEVVLLATADKDTPVKNDYQLRPIV